MRLRRTDNAELFHSELESGAVQTETCSCSIRAREFPLGLFQYGQNVSAFGFFKRLARRGDRGRGAMLEILQGHVKNIARGKNYGAFDEILQFTNVARPGITRQSVHRFCRNRIDIPVHLSCELLDEMTHKQWNVLGTIA